MDLLTETALDFTLWLAGQLIEVKRFGWQCTSQGKKLWLDLLARMKSFGCALAKVKCFGWQCTSQIL